jgi:hypothetical protein
MAGTRQDLSGAHNRADFRKERSEVGHMVSVGRNGHTQMGFEATKKTMDRSW